MPYRCAFGPSNSWVVYHDHGEEISWSKRVPGFVGNFLRGLYSGSGKRKKHSNLHRFAFDENRFFAVFQDGSVTQYGDVESVKAWQEFAKHAAAPAASQNGGNVDRNANDCRYVEGMMLMANDDAMMKSIVQDVDLPAERTMQRVHSELPEVVALGPDGSYVFSSVDGHVIAYHNVPKACEKVIKEHTAQAEKCFQENRGEWAPVLACAAFGAHESWYLQYETRESDDQQCWRFSPESDYGVYHDEESCGMGEGATRRLGGWCNRL